MFEFLTEKWGWKQVSLIALWVIGAVTSFTLPFLFIFSAATITLSLIVLPLVVIKLLQLCIPSVEQNTTQIHTKEETTPPNLTEKTVVPDVEEENLGPPFEFDIPNPAPEPTVLTQLEHPERSYTYNARNARPIGHQRADEIFNQSRLETPKFIEYFKKTYEQIHHSNKKNLHICILGMGPTGLIAALRAYMAGASLTLIDKRDDYTRENVLRLSSSFLFGRCPTSPSHALFKTLFPNLYDSNDDHVGFLVSNFFNISGQQQHGMDPAFREEETDGFYTIRTNALENLLLYLLKHLQQQHPEVITIHRGQEITAIHASESLISLKNTDTPIHADWILNTTGAHGRLHDDRQVQECLFPVKPAYTCYTTHAPYLAATFEGDRRMVVRSGARTLPVGFEKGVQAFKNQRPDLSSKIEERTNLRSRGGSRANTFDEQAVFNKPETREHYIQSPPLGTPKSSREELNLDLACSYYGVCDSRMRMQDMFGWEHVRLPLIRQLNTKDVIYVGMEIPPHLFHQLTSETRGQDEKDTLLISWLNLALEQSFSQSLLEKLRLRQGSVFSVQMRICDSIMHEYADSGVQVFNLGDVLAPPHFLTGSGLESAAIGVDHWINYMSTSNQEEYIANIRSVQTRALDKVDALRELSMFPKPDDAPQVRSELAPINSANIHRQCSA